MTAAEIEADIVEQERLAWLLKVLRLLTEAADAGFVVEVEQKPLKPLAMGNYAPAITVWRRREWQ